MIPLIRNITKEADRQKIVVGVKDSYNRPTCSKQYDHQNDSPNIKQNLKTEIGLPCCLAAAYLHLVCGIIAAYLVTICSVGYETNINFSLFLFVQSKAVYLHQ